MRTLAVVNQKGGVSKTTLTAHLAYAAVEAGLRVLLVDLDKQGSLSQSFEPTSDQAGHMLASSLFNEQAEGQPESVDGGPAIIRADADLARINAGDNEKEVTLRTRPRRNLARFAGQFDVCLIDTPGQLGFNPPTTLAALVAADAVICPINIGLYEGMALEDLSKYIGQIKTPAYNPRLKLLGMLPCKINTRSPEELEGLQVLRDANPGFILPYMLSERSAVKQAVMRRQPVWRSTRGAGHLAAAKEWRTACAAILTLLQEVRK